MSSSAGPQPPPGGIKEQLGTIYKQIREAQTLDANGDEMGAYRHYLSSVGLTAQALSADIQANQGQGTLPEQQVRQLYKMARDCLDRGLDIFASARKEQRPLALFRLATPSPTMSPTLPNHHFPFHPSHPTQQPQAAHLTSQTLPRMMSRGSPQPPRAASQNSQHTRAGVAERNMSWPASRGVPTVRSRQQTEGYDTTDSGTRGPIGQSKVEGEETPQQYRSQPISTVHTMSFMAEARMKNRHMMEQYKSHLRQRYQGKPVYNEAGLSMLRRLEENLSVARIREQNIAKRLKEKELRAREAGAKAKPAVVLSTLTLDELSEQVLSFELGKTKFTNLKARLHSSNSDLSVVYGVISEILSITDHPLSRLLGEYQYNVYMMLQPVGAAVEKAGGLPQLEIRLDNSGLDRKASIEEKPHPLGGSHDLAADDSDALLELLCDDEEEEENGLLASNLPSQPKEDRPKDQPIGHDSFDSKFEQLKKELMSDSKDNGGESGGNETGSKGAMYENFISSDSHTRDKSGVASERAGAVFQNVAQSHNSDDNVLSRAPMFDGEEDENKFDLKENQCYGSTGEAPPTSKVKGVDYNGRKGEVYEDADAVLRFLQEEARKEEREKLGEELNGAAGGNGSHDYEEMDSVFADSANQNGVYDVPDGGMLSRQEVPAPEPEQLELEEIVPFKNLPPLVCTARLGDEVAMKKLADTAGAVLREVVKHIHTSLDKLLECFSKCYSLLNTDENQEVCRTVLEASFFPAILSPLTIVYRCKNYCEEVAVAKNMCQQVNASPRDLSVRKKYWLLEQSHAPYGEAINELRRVTSLQYPSPKLECLVRMSKQIVKCIDDYHAKYSPRSKQGLVGVDDMLPILSYVILRSGLPQLITECSIMEEFIQEGYIMGEEGFCLTSFLTALKYVTQMSS